VLFGRPVDDLHDRDELRRLDLLSVPDHAAEPFLELG
jgi:hypothetical protein